MLRLDVFTEVGGRLSQIVRLDPPVAYDWSGSTPMRSVRAMGYVPRACVGYVTALADVMSSQSVLEERYGRKEHGYG
jgi:hypothetical protein